MLRLDTPFSLEDFKIIPPPSYEISFSEIKISPKSIFFSATTVSELNYTPDIALFFNQESCILVVAPSKKMEYSCPFFDSKQERKSVTIQHEHLTAAIRATMGWPARKGTYRIPGVRPPNSPQTLFCFDLTLGSCEKKTTRKIDPQAFLSACPTLQDVKKPGSKFIPFGLLPGPASNEHSQFPEPEISVISPNGRFHKKEIIIG